MPDLPHIAWPFQADKNGHLLVVEQGSDQDIASCIASILLWPVGTRESDLAFGISEQLFRSGGADLDEIRTAVSEYEPRADHFDLLVDDETMPGLIEQIQAGFNPTLGDETG